MMGEPDVDYVVCSHNNRDIIAPTLDAIAQQGLSKFTCTVVDGLSTDGTPEYIRDRFPWVNIVIKSEDSGPAQSRNIGFTRGSAKYVVFIDSDVQLDSNWTKAQINFMEAYSRIAIAGGRLIDGGTPTILYGAYGNINRFGVAWNEGEGEPVDRYLEPVQCLWINTSALIARREALDDIGIFDEAMFAGYEDCDLGWRANLLGYKVFFNPAAAALHFCHGTLKLTGPWRSSLIYLIRRNRIRCLLINYQLRSLIRYSAFYFLFAFADALLISPRKPKLAAFWWNIPRLRDTLKKRHQVQKRRALRDRDLWPIFTNGLRGPGHLRDISRGKVGMLNRAGIQNKRRRPFLFTAKIALALLLCVILLFAIHKHNDGHSSGTVAAAAEDLGNLLTNPNFEESANGIPAKWILDAKLTPKGSISTIAVPGITHKILQLSPNAKNDESEKPFGLAELIPVKALQGKRVYAQAALRTTPGATGFVLIFTLDKHGKPLSHLVFEQIDPQSDFRQQKGYLTIDADAELVLFACTVNGTSGSALFDSLIFGSAPVTVASSAAASTVAKIHIDATKPWKEIPKTLFGTNVEWVRNGNGLWDPAKDDLDPVLVTRARELGVSVIRYPGGGFADYFDWRKSVGTRKERPEMQHVLDEERSKVLFGTDEFLRLCHLVGAEPMIQTNVIGGTAQDAADWVSYTNKSAIQTGANSRVELWEIGNEQYIKPEATGLPLAVQSYLPTSVYIKRFREFSLKMKQVDPSIRVGALGGRNFGRLRLMYDDDWDRQILTQAGDQIDFLAVHNGYAPLVVGNEDASAFFEIYRAMMGFPKLVDENLRKINDDIETYAPRNANHIKIAITEWGPLFAYSMKNKWIDHSKTLGSALFVASMLQSYLRADRVEIANFFKLTESGFMGSIGADGEPKPDFYSIQMYTRHFGQTLLHTDVESPTFDTNAIGLISAVQDVPYLDVVSSLDKTGSRLYLVVINKNFDQAISTKISTSGFVPQAQGKAWVLTAPSLDANNGKDIPGWGLGWADQAESPKNSMFNAGKPDAVAPQAFSITDASTDFQYSFAPRSITAIELSRVFTVRAGKGAQK